MKTGIKYRKITHIMISIALLLQGCSVYKRENLSLDKATQIQNKFKVQYHTGEVHKFKGIIKENQKIYGIQKKKGQYDKVLLSIDAVKRVQQKDKTASTLLTIALPVGIVTGMVLLLQDSFKWKGGSINPYDFNRE